MFPPGRVLAFGDVAIAVDNLLAAHVAGYEVIHRARPDAVVTTNNSCLSIYEYDRMLTDLLLARSMGIDRDDARRVARRASAPARRRLPPAEPGRAPAPQGRCGPGHAYGSGAVALAGSDRSVDRRAPSVGPDPSPQPGGGARSTTARTSAPSTSSASTSTTPVAARHFRLPGHRTAGGRKGFPTRELWDDVPDPAGLTRWLRDPTGADAGDPAVGGGERAVQPGAPGTVLHPLGRMGPSPLPAGEHRGRDWRRSTSGVPVQGYWHWSLVDNYEWGSYEPRFGLYGVDRHRGEHGTRWLDTDSLGDDAGGAYRTDHRRAAGR